MRVLIAPDKFAGTLSAVDAARAIAAGWLRTAPHDALDLVPLSDGGPGFVDVLATCLDGELLSVTVCGPLGRPATAAILLTADPTLPDGPVAYVESAQACGLHLLAPELRDPTRTTTVGVGDLIAAAVDAGARRVVVGLGGSATTDGGAGLLAALGAVAYGPSGRPDPALLRSGGGALADVRRIDLGPARARVAGIDLVAATDVDNPLLGPRGASAGFAPQKGATPADVDTLAAGLTALAAAVGRTADGKDPAVALGAGAAGGLGFALLALGGRRVAGIATVLAAVDLPARVARADLVVTGEGAFDWQSLRGKVVSGVAASALATARPAVVLAGRVDVGRREWVGLGVTSAYSVVEDAGSVEAALAEPAARLADLAARVARSWSSGPRR